MDGSHSVKTDGSPLPKPPRNTFVRVSNRANDKKASIPLIDLGPSKFAPSHAAIDLTEEAFKVHGGNPRDGVMRVDFVVPGGARYLHGDLSNSEPRSASLGIPSSRRTNMLPLVFGAENTHRLETTINKPAIKTFIQSPNHSSRNGTKIYMIILHCTVGTKVSGTINWFLNRQSRVSPHYVVDRNGDIYQMVSDTECAWHAKGANRRSVGIEHVGTATDQLTEEQSAASAQLVRRLVSTYDVPTANVVGHTSSRPEMWVRHRAPTIFSAQLPPMQ
jgi:hypothetical protein